MTSGIILNLVCYAMPFYTILVMCTTIGLWIIFIVPRSTDTKLKINQQLFSRYLFLQQIPKILLCLVQEGNRRLFETGLFWTGLSTLPMWQCDCGTNGIGNDDIFNGADYLWWVLEDPNRKCTNSFL